MYKDLSLTQRNHLGFANWITRQLQPWICNSLAWSVLRPYDVVVSVLVARFWCIHHEGLFRHETFCSDMSKDTWL